MRLARRTHIKPVAFICDEYHEYVTANDADFFDYFFRFLLPCGLGNIIGGTVIFTLLVYYQVSKELIVGKAKKTRK